MELVAALGEQTVENDLHRRSKAVLKGSMGSADDGDENQPKKTGKIRTKDKEA